MYSRNRFAAAEFLLGCFCGSIVTLGIVAICLGLGQ